MLDQLVHTRFALAVKPHLEQQLQLQLPLESVYDTEVSFSKNACFLQGRVGKSKGEAVRVASLPPQSLQHI